MARIPWKRQTMKITGWTSTEYDKRYNSFRKQVDNYNRVSGAKYSAAEEFFYSQKYAGKPSAALSAILETAKTTPHGAGQSPWVSGGRGEAKATSIAADAVLKRWGGFIAESRKRFLEGHGSGEAMHVAQLLDAGLISPEEANRQLVEIRANKAERTEKDPTYHY